MTQATKKLIIFYALTLIYIIAICCYGAEDATCCYGTEGGNATCCDDKKYCYSWIDKPGSGLVTDCSESTIQKYGECKDINGPNKDFCDQKYSKCVCGSYECNQNEC